MRESMEGKIALVTGGGTGIGKAAALAFAAAGARVVIASRTLATGEQVVQDIRAAGGDALWIKTDVSQLAPVEAMIQETIAAFGP